MSKKKYFFLHPQLDCELKTKVTVKLFFGNFRNFQDLYIQDFVVSITAVRMNFTFTGYSRTGKPPNCTLLVLTLIKKLRENSQLGVNVINGNFHWMFSFNNNNLNTQGHSLKLNVIYTRLDCRRRLFCNRVIKIWNALPESIISLRRFDRFKMALNNYNLRFYCKGRAFNI